MPSVLSPVKKEEAGPMNQSWRAGGPVHGDRGCLQSPQGSHHERRAGLTVLSCLMFQLLLFLLKNITLLGPTFLFFKDKVLCGSVWP